MDVLMVVILVLGALGAVAAFLMWKRFSARYAEVENARNDFMEKYYSAQARAQSLESELIAKKDSILEISTQMKDTFQALAHQTLEGQSKQFLDLAQSTLARHTDLAQKDLLQRQTSIDALLNPLRQTLETVQKQTAEIEKERQKSYTTVENELRRVIESSQNLSQETRSLKDALKKPHIRGRWGEVQLKNCVELAGMSEFADVTFQDVNTLDEGRLIPDMTVKMPGGRIVIVDAKTPLDGFIASLEATTEDEKNIQMKRHGLQVKDHVKKLSQKAYNEHLTNSADFTVMFLPNESFLYAALETQSDLIEFALDKKILIATPPTFVGLLKVIRYGWNEDRLAKTAETVRDIGRELHKRLVDFTETYVAIGKSLDSAKDRYDEGFKRLNSRLAVQARKMEKLGVKGSKSLPEELAHDTDDEPPLLGP